MKEHFRQEFIRCGKPNCKRCPHGPYWYAYRTVKGKLRKRYVGKIKPGTFARRGGMSPHEARKVLGLSPAATKSEARKAFASACAKHHPDRGGKHEEMVWINAAWDVLKAL